MKLRRLLADHLKPLALALGVGIGGGLLFHALKMPLPWMLGATTCVTILALAGAKVRVQFWLREPMVILIAVLLGSAFTPDAIAEARHYAVSMTLLALYVLFTVALLMLYFRRVARYDFATAYFASIPGGLMEMVVMGRETGGDDRKIFLAHGTRIFLVVFTIPFWFRLVEGYVPQPGLGIGGNSVSIVDFRWLDGAILLACGIAGFYLGKWLRFPASRFTGPLVASAVAHLVGWTESKPPAELVVLAQIVLGTALGCRYVGVHLGEILGTLRKSLGAALILLVSAAAFSYAIHAVTGTDSQAMLLSLAPGGLVEMTLIALALGIDIAFVTIHHLVRIMIAVFIAPLAYGAIARRLAPAKSREKPGESS